MLLVLSLRFNKLTYLIFSHDRSSIHHKTSPSGGTQSHGFPDPEYFRNCNGELDGVSVPSAHALDDDGRIIITSTKKGK